MPFAARNLDHHRTRLVALAGAPGWQHLELETTPDVWTVLADVHTDCGNMRHHVEVIPPDTTLHTCLDCALAKAEPPPEE